MRPFRKPRPAAALVSVLFAGTAYLCGMAAIAAFALFVADIPWLRGIDDGRAGPLLPAVLVDLWLVTLFGIQHSVMARPAFKAELARELPPPLIRAFYVLCSAMVLAALVWVWQPLPQPVWSLEHPAARAVAWTVHGLGWAMVLVSTFLLSHAELFGLAQVRDWVRGRPPSAPAFRTPFLYKVVRHPLMLGFLIALWAGPDASQGRVLLAGAFTVYILVGTALEERDLRATLGTAYTRYAARVPALVPGAALAGRAVGTLASRLRRTMRAKQVTDHIAADIGLGR